MKTAYLNKEGLKKKLTSWFAETRLLEKEDKEQAIKEYKKMAAAYPTSEEPYDRLMILYRQLKESEEELHWIETAIAVFRKSFNKSSKKPNSKIASLSKSLLRATGLVDKRGISFYEPQPIMRWEKRKELLIKKMK
jgi:tetratricopeptide (TPR) repeat protein